MFGKVRVCIQKNLLRTVLMISSVTQPSSSAAEDFHDKIQAQHPIWSSQVIIYLFGSVSEVSLYKCCSFHLMASSHRPKVQLTSSRRFRLDQGPMLVGLLSMFRSFGRGRYTDVCSVHVNSCYEILIQPLIIVSRRICSEPKAEHW